MDDQHQTWMEDKGGDLSDGGATWSCSNVRVKVRDVEIDQHFFVQETSSHLVIVGIKGHSFQLVSQV